MEGRRRKKRSKSRRRRRMISRRRRICNFKRPYRVWLRAHEEFG